MRFCSRCRTAKDLSQFFAKKNRPDGLRSECKECCRTYAKTNAKRISEYQRNYRKLNSEELKGQKLKRHYGIDRAEYRKILAEQCGACAICKTTDSGRWESFHVDHDHVTGDVRGLLCHGCNTALGQLGDDPAVACKMLYDYAVKNYPQRMAG